MKRLPTSYQKLLYKFNLTSRGLKTLPNKLAVEN